jgi:hypothetical protein
MANANGATGWFARNTKLVAIAGAVVAVIIAVLMIVQYNFAVRNEGEVMQERIETLYKSSQNSLSTCIDQGTIGAQVTQQERESLGDLLTNVASARYTDASGNPTNASAALGGGQLISMLQENYPQISDRLFLNLQTTVIGCRSAFQGAQDRLFIDAQNFESWQLSDNLFNSGIKKEFPSATLDVQNLATGATETGAAALAYMTRVITVKAANDAFESGTLAEQDLFGTKADPKK